MYRYIELYMKLYIDMHVDICIYKMYKYTVRAKVCTTFDKFSLELVISL